MADQPKLIQTRTVNVIVDSNLFITRKLSNFGLYELHLNEYAGKGDNLLWCVNCAKFTVGAVE